MCKCNREEESIFDLKFLYITIEIDSADTLDDRRSNSLVGSSEVVLVFLEDIGP